MERTIKISVEEEKMIMEQIKYLHAEYISIQQSFLGFTSLSVGAYAIILYQVFEDYDSNKFIFLVLPFLFLLSVYNVGKYTMKMMGLDAYTRYLEYLINVSHKKILFSWQSFLIYANGYSFFGIIPQIPCYVVLAIVLGIKYHENINYYEVFPGFGNLLTAILATEIVLLIIMLYHVGKQYYIVLDVCKEITVEIIDDFTWQRLKNLHTERPPYLRKKCKR